MLRFEEVVLRYVGNVGLPQYCHYLTPQHCALFQLICEYISNEIQNFMHIFCH